MTIDAATVNVPRQKRAERRPRWFRFSLRTLLILTVVLSIAFGWIGSVLVRVRHQRQIVAHVESRGGRVAYDYERAETARRAPDGTIVPPGPAFIRWIFGIDVFAHVESVEFRDPAQAINDRDLERVAELPRLNQLLIVNGEAVTDSAFRHLVHSCDLQSLVLGDAQISLQWLRSLQNEASFTSLSITGSLVDDQAMETIAKIPQLQSLTLDDVEASSVGLSNIGEMSELKYLRIFNTPTFDDKAMREVGKLRNLESLVLNEASVSDIGLQEIANLHRLRSISISKTAITDDGMVHVSGLKYLKSLSLAGLPVGDRTFEAASKVKSLEFLNMGGTKLTDDGLRHAGEMKNLRTLGIPYTGVTDEGLEHLAALQELDLLRLSSGVTLDGAKKLKRALPYCEVVFFEDNRPGIVIMD